MMTQTAFSLTDADASSLRDLRRDLHRYPELGYQELRTAAAVAERLRAAGLRVETGVAQTGVVATLEADTPGAHLGYRADMDALPIEELNDVPYRSCHAGLMHACGHDVHTTIGVGVAELLARHRQRLRGRFTFVFQPNEEGAPGAGLSGGDAVIADGFLERHPLDGLFALHCLPSLDVGHIGFCPRGVWAGSDRLEVHVQGEQAHAAYPHLGVDPIVTAAHIITALQSITSRTLDTQQACVLSITQVRAGEQFNVLPADVHLGGILRTLDPAVRARALEAAERIVRQTAAAFGAEATLRAHPGAQPVLNDAALLDRALTALRRHTPAECVRQVAPQMGAEDFAAFRQRLPSVYLLLGVRNAARGIEHGLHTPRFDVDEACIPLAVEAMARTLAELA